MGATASQITSPTIAYSTVYSDAGPRKHQSFASLAFVQGNSPGTGELPAQMASNAEIIFIWWHHHDVTHANIRFSRNTLKLEQSGRRFADIFK